MPIQELRAVYDQHMKTIYGFFMAKTGQRSVAEDLTQEVFVSVHEQIVNGKQIEDLAKYTYGVMKFVWIGYLRTKYSNPEQLVADNEDFDVLVRSTVASYESSSVVDRAMPYIEKLPDSQKQVAMMRFVEGLTPQQVCERLGCNKNYVKTTQKRALISLREMKKGELV